MKKSSKAGAKACEKKNQALTRKLKTLEKEWKSLEKSKPRMSSNASANNTILTSLNQLHLLENSPRQLMSSLQHRTSPSPSDRFPKVRSCDFAVEEILRDRKAAIMSGKLKGRRLFDRIDVANDEVELEWDCDGGSDHWFNMIQERQVMMVNQNCDGTGSPSRASRFSDSGDETAVEEKVVVEVGSLAERRGGGRLSSGGGGGRCMVVLMAWFAFVLILFILGNGKSVRENLIPT